MPFHAIVFHAQVHDVLAMRLNRITLPDNGAAPALPGAAAAKKSYEVDDGALPALLNSSFCLHAVL